MAGFDFFAAARELARRGEPFVTATVVRVERPTSGKPGDRAIVTLDGRLDGWVGGSCTRPTVVEKALEALRDGRSRLVRLSREPDERTAREGITDLSMTCFSGGTMEIFIEPHTPRPRLLIVGTQPVARSLGALGRAMGYEIVAAATADPSEDGDPRALPGTEGPRIALDELGTHVHPLTAIVVASHGDHDEIAVERALSADAPYVGLVASRKRTASIVEHLRGRGLDEDRLASLHAPAGLDIQAREPEEIALSILAEIVQMRRGRDTFAWAAKAAATGETAPDEATAAPATAKDPVCGMIVETAGAQRTVYQGSSYFFCCGGCLTRFSADPESFLATG